MTRAMFRPVPARLLCSFSLFPRLVVRAGQAASHPEVRCGNYVTPDAKVDVTENITFQFKGGPWHGVYRTIPVEYIGPSGLNYSLFLDVRSITDANGNKLKFESSRVGHNRKLKIYVPDADNSTQTVVIDYVVSDALRFFEDYDEFYWNVTGDEWTSPLTRPARTSSFLPAPPVFAPTSSPAPSAPRARGCRGSRWHRRGRHHHRSSGHSRGLTVAVAFDKGAVHEPTAADKLFFTSAAIGRSFCPSRFCPDVLVVVDQGTRSAPPAYRRAI